uniref:Uncharacterized protein n=1 Tax=Anguilla anguilla TaxID=7936 RepID=A0A0E9XRK0_ANGAN
MPHVHFSCRETFPRNDLSSTINIKTLSFLAALAFRLASNTKILSC